MTAPASSVIARLRGRLPGALGTRLLMFLGAAIVLTALLQGLLAYRNALLQTDTLFDYQMQQTAFALRAGLPVDARGRPQGTPPEDETTNSSSRSGPTRACAFSSPRWVRHCRRWPCWALPMCPRAAPSVPRVLAADALAGDPGGAGHARAPHAGARCRLAKPAAHRLAGARAGAGRVVGGAQFAGARAARAPRAGRAPPAGPGPPCRPRACRRGAAPGGRAQRAAAARGPGLRGAAALRGGRRARAALSAGRAQAATGGLAARARCGRA